MIIAMTPAELGAKPKPMELHLKATPANVLRAFVRETSYHPWPTIREVCKRSGVASTSVVNYHVRELVHMGLLAAYSPDGNPDHAAYSSRCIGLTPAGEAWIERNTKKGTRR